MKLETKLESFRLAETFTISRGSKTHADVITVKITDRGITGRGECVPYSRYGETHGSVIKQIRSLPQELSRKSLQTLLPAGAARNAVDCALWDLQAKIQKKRVWELAGLEKPGPKMTAFTISLDSPDRMKSAAERNAHRPVLKIKLGTPDDLQRLEAVREGAPGSQILVDANEGWSVKDFEKLTPHLLRLNIAMIEQPFPAGHDKVLEKMARPIPVCADESCHDRQSLPVLKGRYDVINIKLDKTGGLTEALALRDVAHARGFKIMSGCMVSSSLAIAPAILIAQKADFIDLDGPLLLAEDRKHSLRYDKDGVHPPDSELWG